MKIGRENLNPAPLLSSVLLALVMASGCGGPAFTAAEDLTVRDDASAPDGGDDAADRGGDPAVGIDGATEGDSESASDGHQTQDGSSDAIAAVEAGSDGGLDAAADAACYVVRTDQCALGQNPTFLFQTPTQFCFADDAGTQNAYAIDTPAECLCNYTCACILPHVVCSNPNYPNAKCGVGPNGGILTDCMPNFR